MKHFLKFWFDLEKTNKQTSNSEGLQSQAKECSFNPLSTGFYQCTLQNLVAKLHHKWIETACKSGFIMCDLSQRTSNKEKFRSISIWKRLVRGVFLSLRSKYYYFSYSLLCFALCSVASFTTTIFFSNKLQPQHWAMCNFAFASV